MLMYVYACERVLCVCYGGEGYAGADGAPAKYEVSEKSTHHKLYPRRPANKTPTQGHLYRSNLVMDEYQCAFKKDKPFLIPARAHPDDSGGFLENGSKVVYASVNESHQALKTTFVALFKPVALCSQRYCSAASTPRCPCRLPSAVQWHALKKLI